MRFRFLLRPGWLGLTLVVFLFAVACYAVLAPWQFSRNAEQSALNADLQASFTSQPLPLEQLLPQPTAPTSGEQWRQVVVRGHYLADAEAMARLRTVQGEAASEVLTPFQLDSGRIVLVDRGYVRPVSGKPVPDYAAPPAGDVSLVARLLSDEPIDSRATFVEAGHRQVYTVNAETVGKAGGITIAPGYLQLDPDQPGVLSALPLPQLDSGPYLSYAVQWLIFGAMAILGWAYFSWREARPGGALDNGAKPVKRKTVAQILAEDASGAPTVVR